MIREDEEIHLKQNMKFKIFTAEILIWDLESDLNEFEASLRDAKYL